MEGVVRDVKHEKKHANSLRKSLRQEGIEFEGINNNPLMFGAENEWVDVFTDLVIYLPIIYMIAKDMEGAEYYTTPGNIARIEFLESFKDKHSLYSRLWGEFVKHEEEMPLTPIVIHKHRGLMNKLNKRIKLGFKESDVSHFLDLKKYSYIEWYSLLSKFGLFVMDKYLKNLPEGKGLNYELLYKVLDDVAQSYEMVVQYPVIFYLRCKVNNEWRNSFIVQNTIDILENEAKQVNKDVYLIIGNDHFAKIKSQFAEKGYEVDTSLHVGRAGSLPDCVELETIIKNNQIPDIELDII